MKQLLILLIAAATIPAWASEPGQPLDCSDWVIVEPGLSMSTTIPYPCPDVEGAPTSGCRSITGNIDNTGGFFFAHISSLGVECNPGGSLLNRHAIYRFRDGEDELIAYLDNRCGANPICSDETSAAPPGGFDDKNGSLFISMQHVHENGPGPDCGEANYARSSWAVNFDHHHSLSP